MPPSMSPSPPLTLLAREPVRAALEYARMRFMPRDALPTGDGHPVVVFPGLGADHRAVAPLVRHCAALGYAAYDWGRGLNRGPNGDVQRWLDRLTGHVRRLIARHDTTATLIGWSLGGIYAREIAKRTDGIRQVIAIGAPFAGTPAQTNAVWLYRLLSGQAPIVHRDLARRLRAPPPVPVTSIYSRSDGVVAWQACREIRSRRTENIEVDSSHLGLVCHRDVHAIIADRLAQPDGAWRPWRAGAERRAA